MPCSRGMYQTPDGEDCLRRSKTDQPLPGSRTGTEEWCILSEGGGVGDARQRCVRGSPLAVISGAVHGLHRRAASGPDIGRDRRG